jgi:hypothetical protein
LTAARLKRLADLRKEPQALKDRLAKVGFAAESLVNQAKLEAKMHI